MPTRSEAGTPATPAGVTPSGPADSPDSNLTADTTPRIQQIVPVQVALRLRPEIAALDGPADASAVEAEQRSSAEAERRSSAGSKWTSLKDAYHRPTVVDAGGGTCTFRGSQYKFERIFPAESSTAEVFSEACEAGVRGVLGVVLVGHDIKLPPLPRGR